MFSTKMRTAGVEEEQKQTIQTLENEHLQLKETIKEQQARPAENLMKSPHLERVFLCFTTKNPDWAKHESQNTPE